MTDSAIFPTIVNVMIKGGRLGEFEELVLLSVHGLGTDAYTVRIQDRLREDTKRSPALGAIYAALDRMECKGYVRSRLGAPTAARGGRRKRFYSATGQGLAVLRAQRDTRVALWRRIETKPTRGGA